jgi:hypothetical protein
MPSDIRIPPVSSLPAGSEAMAETKAQGSSHASYPSRSVEQPPTTPAIANPSLRLDPALGLVVLEFHSGTGAVTTSIPSERQLEAYQRWTQTGIGAPPGGMGSGATADGVQGTQARAQARTQAPPAQPDETATQVPRPSQDQGDPASSQDP